MHPRHVCESDWPLRQRGADASRIVHHDPRAAAALAPDAQELLGEQDAVGALRVSAALGAAVHGGRGAAEGRQPRALLVKAVALIQAGRVHDAALDHVVHRHPGIGCGLVLHAAKELVPAAALQVEAVHDDVVRLLGPELPPRTIALHLHHSDVPIAHNVLPTVSFIVLIGGVLVLGPARGRGYLPGRLEAQPSHLHERSADAHVRPVVGQHLVQHRLHQGAVDDSVAVIIALGVRVYDVADRDPPFRKSCLEGARGVKHDLRPLPQLPTDAQKLLAHQDAVLTRSVPAGLPAAIDGARGRAHGRAGVQGPQGDGRVRPAEPQGRAALAPDLRPLATVRLLLLGPAGLPVALARRAVPPLLRGGAGAGAGAGAGGGPRAGSPRTSGPLAGAPDGCGP
mmetsp:Transcript_65046/g.169222  ORF Transcript_65046/g.169222 Transcript_65046/m.169222 type:complete len:397 (+) Transcript_65046:739-1929(+)